MQTLDINNKSLLIKKYYFLQNRLNKSITTYGLSSPLCLAISKKLDIVVAELQKNKMYIGEIYDTSVSKM